MRERDELGFDDRVVVITGAARGLGYAYATAFAERGACVVVNDVLGTNGHDPAGDVAARLRASGGRAVASTADIRDAEEAATIVDTALEAFGRLDVVVNNAGIGHVGSLEEPLASFNEVLATNLLGTVHVTRAAWPHLVGAGHGRVVNTTSAVGLWGAPHSVAYATAKAGVVGLTAALAIDGAPHDVLVNCVAPAAETRLTRERFPRPGSRRWRPELVAPAVLYLADETCTESGTIVAAFAGLFSVVEIVQGPGHRFDARGEVDLDDFVAELDGITSMDGARRFDNGHLDALGTPLGTNLRQVLEST